MRHSADGGDVAVIGGATRRVGGANIDQRRVDITV